MIKKIHQYIKCKIFNLHPGFNIQVYTGNCKKHPQIVMECHACQHKTIYLDAKCFDVMKQVESKE